MIRTTPVTKSLTISQNLFEESADMMPLEDAKKLLSSFSEQIKIEQTKIDKEKAKYKTKFKKEFCYKAIQVMSCGAGIKETQVALGIGSYRTFKNYIERYAIFDLAINIGKTLSEVWWREQGRRNLYNRNFNHTLWMMNMNNRFGWSRNLEVSQKIDAKYETKETINVKIEETKLAMLGKEELYRLQQILINIEKIKPNEGNNNIESVKKGD
jgi:hypothetical protein